MTGETLYFVCQFCAHIETSDATPDRCENCGAKPEDIEPFDSLDEAAEDSDEVLRLRYYA